MAEPAHSYRIDQDARDMAQRALAVIERHEQVCEERNKAQAAFERRTEEWLRRFQAGYEAQVDEIRLLVETRGERLRTELSEATKPLYNRFWALAVSTIGGLFLLCGFLIVKLLNW